MGHPRTGTPVRVGLVGAGGVGARHARTLAGFPDVELVGVTDAVPGAADALADELGVPVVADVDRLLTQGLDGVWLCVPPFAHGELELAAVRAGVPFLVEKPLSTGVAVAEEVARAVAGAGLPTATGYPADDGPCEKVPRRRSLCRQALPWANISPGASPLQFDGTP